MEKEQLVKIVVTVPIAQADKLRRAMAKAGAGHLGKYDSCSFSWVGTGRFRPLKGAKPFIGSKGKVEEVKEEIIEVTCPHPKIQRVLSAIKKAHPYEEPVIDIYPLSNNKY